jgi:hypothetical protein
MRLTPLQSRLRLLLSLAVMLILLPGFHAFAQSLDSQEPRSPSTAALVEEDRNQKLGRRYPGLVTWTTQKTSLPSDGETTLSVRAEIKIPERQLAASISFAPSDVVLVLVPLSGIAHGNVAAVRGVAMKPLEAARAVSFFGQPSKSDTNRFRIALARNEPERMFNLKLLKEEQWFDIAIFYDDGTRAIVVLEKGPSGERAFADALAAWK